MVISNFCASLLQCIKKKTSVSKSKKSKRQGSDVSSSDTTGMVTNIGSGGTLTAGRPVGSGGEYSGHQQSPCANGLQSTSPDNKKKKNARQSNGGKATVKKKPSAEKDDSGGIPLHGATSTLPSKTNGTGAAKKKSKETEKKDDREVSLYGDFMEGNRLNFCN